MLDLPLACGVTVISAILAPLRARALRHQADQREVHEKILFGTDFPLPYSIRINGYDLASERKNAISRIGNPFDRYISAILE